MSTLNLFCWSRNSAFSPLFLYIVGNQPQVRQQYLKTFLLVILTQQNTHLLHNAVESLSQVHTNVHNVTIPVFHFIIFCLMTTVFFHVDWSTKTQLSLLDISSEFRSTCGAQLQDQTHHILAWRSTSAGRWKVMLRWSLQSRQNIYALGEQ